MSRLTAEIKSECLQIYEQLTRDTVADTGDIDVDNHVNKDNMSVVL